jgi:diguanylate cyclase (GGDEF)-like protein
MDNQLLKYTQELHILYVEDDERLREKTIQIFQELFKSVDTAIDGYDGLEKYYRYYKEHDRYYDIVISDIQMPNTNGIEMSEAIRNRNPDQHIIISSAFNDSDYLEKFLELGVDGFLHKPVKFIQLAKVIEKAAKNIHHQKEHQNYVEKINNINKELEEKVAQRTKELEKLVYTDPLTGYGNRYKLNQDMSNSIEPALALLNIDNFSQINDFYGHILGDQLLQKLAELLGDALENSTSELYHLQGDEFVIFNSDIEKESFSNMIQYLLESIQSNPININNEEINMKLTTAISFDNKQKLLVNANMALKHGKKESVELIIYNDTLNLEDQYKNNFKWANRIKQGISEDRFVPIFQPIINNANEMCEKEECLVRLQSDDKLLTPNNFLNISKQTKHYIYITKMMLKKSFESFASSETEFSVNLTIEDILNESINDYILELLSSYGIGNRVVFEIVESESIDNFTEVEKFITLVKSFGCKIAVDDFGTGYSNFHYLIKLNVDYIKIDGSLIQQIDTDKEKQNIVSTIVDFAKKMDIKTIAEFVENKRVFETVKELGIDYSQGYYFGKPHL